jgi:hypothetical protein
MPPSHVTCSASRMRLRRLLVRRHQGHVTVATTEARADNWLVTRRLRVARQRNFMALERLPKVDGAAHTRMAKPRTSRNAFTSCLLAAATLAGCTVDVDKPRASATQQPDASVDALAAHQKYATLALQKGATPRTESGARQRGRCSGIARISARERPQVRRSQGAPKAPSVSELALYFRGAVATAPEGGLLLPSKTGLFLASG